MGNPRPSTAGRSVRERELRQLVVAVIVLVAAFTLLRLSLLPRGILGVNDASRWATVRALVDNGTYAVGRREWKPDGTFTNTGIVTEPRWQTMDKVLHPEENLFYSSKPPLLPTLVAGWYWTLKRGFNVSIVEHTKAVAVSTAIIVNLAPFLLSLWLLFRMSGRYTRNAWTRLFVVVCSGFATMVPSFLTVFNNHTVATWVFTGALWFFLPIWHDGQRAWWRFALCGLLTGLLVTNELPLLLLLPVPVALLSRRDHMRTMLGFLPCALAPIVAQALLGAWIYGTILPLYAMHGTVWYQYPGSYWLHPRGIDALHPSTLTYIVNITVGHHGFLSLTPVFFLSLWSAFLLRKRLANTAARGLSWMTLGLFLILVGIYAVISKNYSGLSMGMRWFMWITPLWLLLMIPALDRLSRSRGGRIFAWTLFSFSAFSTFFSPLTPWHHPWIYILLQSLFYA